jgi:hypothetical protein
MSNTDREKARQAKWRTENPEKSRACSNAWKAANPARVRAYRAAWYAANAEESRAYAAAYHETHREEERDKRIRRYADDPQKYRDARKAYYYANLEKGQAEAREWQARNPERARQNCSAWSAANNGMSHLAVVKMHPSASYSQTCCSWHTLCAEVGWMPRPSEWHFASYRLVVPAADDQDSFFARALRQSDTLRSRNFEWWFMDVDDLAYEGEPFMFGRLCKNKPVSARERIDRDRRRITVEPLSDELLAKSAFFVFPRQHLMAIHPERTTVAAFGKTVAEFVRRTSNIGFVDFAMNEIAAVDEINRAICEYASIEKLSISLMLPNPRLNPAWKDVNDDMRAMEASVYRQQFVPGRGKSLSIANDSRAQRCIQMAADGYGTATVTAKDEKGERHVASTRYFPLTAEAPSIESSSREHVLSILVKRFREIISRGG